MSVKDRLQLILITYNRANHVKNTLTQLMSENSKVKDFDLLVIDNNSTDNTAEIVSEFVQNHANITYIKNKYNIGLAGNIAKAIISANKEYVWILGDDDKYDFSNWAEVEQAINNNEKLICIARYVLPDEPKNNAAYQLFQLTFITGGIYHISLFNDTTVKNVVDNIYTLFPHVPPIVQYINEGGKIYVVDKAISSNGWEPGSETDVSYIRGVKNSSELYDRTIQMNWILGYSNIVSLLKDKNLQKECLEVSIPYKDIYGSWENFYNCIKNQYVNIENFNYFYEIYKVLPDEHKKHFDLENVFLLSLEFKTLLEHDKILINKADEMFIQHDNLRIKINELNQKYDDKVDKLYEKIDKLYQKVDNLYERIEVEKIKANEINENVELKLDYIITKLQKPTLIQQIFSVKNEGNHNVIRILGFKIKIKKVN